VASDGDNESSSGGSGGGSQQTTTDSEGTAQAGPANVEAPVRLLSDGNDTSSGGDSGGGQTTTGSGGTVQVGIAGANAPVRVLSDGDDGAGAGSPGATSPGDSAAAPESDEGSVLQADPVPDTAPAGDVLERGEADDPSGGAKPVAAVLGAQADSLPLTGLGLLALFALGLGLLSNGAALRRWSVQPG
jgi:hypothetical protein